MGWNLVIGQKRVKKILQRSFIADKISHAYLFHGPEGTGKDAAAIEFAKVLNCEQPDHGEACNTCTHCHRIASLQHPNLKIIIRMPVGKNEKEGDDPFQKLEPKMIAEYRQAMAEKASNPYYRINLTDANKIKINSIRDIRRTINLARAERGKKVIIISEADTMNDSSANSLLKTLEEPAPNTVIILTTSHHDALLPTIISRCQMVRFELLREEEIKNGILEMNESFDEQQAILIAKMANGGFHRAQELVGTDLVAQREEMIDILRNILVRSPSMWMKEIEEFLGPKDRYAVVRSLMLLNLWMRDALVLQHNNREGIINLDQQESIAKFIDHFNKADLTAVVRAIERAIALVGKNIYLSLVLINLAFELRQAILRQ